MRPWYQPDRRLHSRSGLKREKCRALSPSREAIPESLIEHPAESLVSDVRGSSYVSRLAEPPSNKTSPGRHIVISNAIGGGTAMFTVACVWQLTRNIYVGSSTVSSSIVFMQSFSCTRSMAQNLLGVKEQPQQATRVWRVTSLVSSCRNEENLLRRQFIDQ